MPLMITQVQGGQLALCDESGNVLGVFDDSGAKRLKVEALLKSGQTLAVTGPTTPSDTQPVSATSLPLPTGAATETGNLASIKTDLDNIYTRQGDGNQKTKAVLYDASGNAVSVVLDGAIYRLQTGSKIARASDGAFVNPATEDTLALIKSTDGIKKIVDALPTGTNEIGKVAQGTKGAGSNAWPVALYDGSGNPLTSQQVEGRGAAGVAPVGNPVYVAGTDGSLLRALLTDNLGRIIIAPSGTASQLKGFSDGQVTTSVAAAIRSTGYVEQTSGAQRSVKSDNANDTAAGTGARAIRITYYKSDFTGPYTTDVTLNGTTAVNTSVSDICYIEQIDVLTVGSGGVNAGIISVYTTTGGGGSVFASIAAASGQTYYAHHYVATGKTCYITSCYLGGVGGAAYLRFQNLGIANAMDRRISDTLRVSAQSATIRLYGTPLVVLGPSRLVMWALPDANNSTYYASFDWYEE